jgi:hypothetical protein
MRTRARVQRHFPERHPHLFTARPNRTYLRAYRREELGPAPQAQGQARHS